MVKGFGFTPEYVLYEMSYANLTLYSSTLPSYKKDGLDSSNRHEEVVNADDPANKEKILEFLQSRR